MGNLWCTTTDTQKLSNVNAQGSWQSSLEKHLVHEKKVSECFIAVFLPLLNVLLQSLCIVSVFTGCR